MKKLFLSVLLFFSCIMFALNVQAGTYVSKYNHALSRSEKKAICSQLEASAKSTSGERNGLGGGPIPDEVLESIYNTTHNISNSVMLVSILGDTLMCHATHAAKENLEIFGIYLGSYPNIPIWLCGAVIYFFGFMLILSITFYVVDISFKLGFAIILMPIGIALWPFEKTKDKIVILISIFLKSAAIFSFLAITVAYTLGMLSEALSGLKEVFEAIAQNDTDYIGNTFTLDATTFLLVVTALAYGMKLIGSSLPEYVDKFFPDKAFGGASPMHHLSTQAMDFAKKKVVEPVATFAGNVAETQLGKGAEKVGKFARGGYHEEIKSGIKNIGRAVRNPRETFQKVGVGIVHQKDKALAGIGRGLNNIKYGSGIAAANLLAGKQNRQDLKNKLRTARDEQNQNLTEGIEQKYKDARNAINQRIDNNENLHAQAKQREHEEKMENDPAYRQKFMEKQQRKEKSEQRHKQRLEKIDSIDERLKNIDENKKAHQIKTEKFYGFMDNVANNINNGKPSARLLQGLHNVKEEAFKNIDTGKSAAKVGDGFFKRNGKALARGLKKTGVTLGLGLAQVPLGVVAGAGNVVVNTVNTAVKLTGGSLMGGVNAVVGGIYGVKKIIPSIQKTFHRAPDIAVNILKTPGNVLEKTGQAMQHHKKK